MTTPELLYSAMRGEPMPSGNEQCFWCGASCPAKHRTKHRVSSSFVGYADVRVPASAYVCDGCVLATDEADRSMRPRQASWVVTTDNAQRLTWASLDVLRDACLSPPELPFAIVLAVSGQKHLLYRAPVNGSRNTVLAQVETETIAYRPAELRGRMELCQRIAAASGKPSLAERPTTGMAIALSDYYADPEPLIETWSRVWTDPLSRLAATLCAAKEQCRECYPSNYVKPVRSAAVATQARRPDRPGRQPDTGQQDLFAMA